MGAAAMPQVMLPLGLGLHRRPLLVVVPGGGVTGRHLEARSLVRCRVAGSRCRCLLLQGVPPPNVPRGCFFWQGCVQPWGRTRASPQASPACCRGAAVLLAARLRRKVGDHRLLERARQPPAPGLLLSCCFSSTWQLVAAPAGAQPGEPGVFDRIECPASLLFAHAWEQDGFLLLPGRSGQKRWQHPTDWLGALSPSLCCPLTTSSDTSDFGEQCGEPVSRQAPYKCHLGQCHGSVLPLHPNPSSVCISWALWCSGERGEVGVRASLGQVHFCWVCWSCALP